VTSITLELLAKDFKQYRHNCPLFLNHVYLKPSEKQKAIIK